MAIDAGAVVGLEAADVSTTVESDRFVGVERSMTWGTTAGAIYGSHAETATAAPSPTWFLAEGSTVLEFDLFYLLQNPQATTTSATVRFLLPSGTTITRTYDLRARQPHDDLRERGPGARTRPTCRATSPPTRRSSSSGRCTAACPASRSRSAHDSMGVTAAATSWFLAEGATGTFFDLYVLIANPGSTDATVQRRLRAA